MNASGAVMVVSELTLREWFAGQALAGMMANTESWRTASTMLADWAYEAADAMIAARREKGGER